MQVIPIPFPVLIGLVDIGGNLDLDVGRLCQHLNNLQSVFQINWIRERLEVTATYPEGKHNHPDSVFFDLLKPTRERWGYANVIGLTRQRLDESRFNVHDATAGIGLITVDDAEEIKPIDVTLEQYVSYLILCEVFCIVGKKHLEHEERNLCLFDLCGEKSDLRDCLTHPQICKRCLKHDGDLVKQGFSNVHLSAASQILQYVGTPSLTQAIKQDGDRFLPGAIVGLLLGLIIDIVAHNVVLLSPLSQIAIIVITFLVVILLVGYKWHSLKRVPAIRIQFDRK